MNELMSAALERAKRTAIEYICASIPVGTVITPAMLKNFDINAVKWIVLAWIVTGVIQVASAYFWALKTGLPEAECAIEATDDIDLPPTEYGGLERYDDRYIDDDVDEGEDDDME